MRRQAICYFMISCYNHWVFTKRCKPRHVKRLRRPPRRPGGPGSSTKNRKGAASIYCINIIVVKGKYQYLSLYQYQYHSCQFYMMIMENQQRKTAKSLRSTHTVATPDGCEDWKMKMLNNHMVTIEQSYGHLMLFYVVFVCALCSNCIVSLP